MLKTLIGFLTAILIFVAGYAAYNYFGVNSEKKVQVVKNTPTPSSASPTSTFNIKISLTATPTLKPSPTIITTVAPTIKLSPTASLKPTTSVFSPTISKTSTSSGRILPDTGYGEYILPFLLIAGSFLIIISLVVLI